MTIGEKILSLRKARSWSQEELAEQIGVTRQAVSRWEAGSAKPDTDKVIAICDLFGVSADYLLRDYTGTAAVSTESVQETQPKQSTALEDAVRAWTLNQWIGAIMSCVFGGILALLYILSIVFPCWYDGYTGLYGFLLTYDVVFLWYICLMGLIFGILRWISPKGILPPDVLEDLKTFFNWNG